jgi:pilin isopeptide linkage protein/LPXTG-motif cell wall-anchored protein
MSQHPQSPRIPQHPKPRKRHRRASAASVAVFVAVCVVAFTALLFAGHRIAAARTYANLAPDEFAAIEDGAVGKAPLAMSPAAKQAVLAAADSAVSAPSFVATANGSISVAKVVEDSASGAVPPTGASFTFTIRLAAADGAADTTAYLAFEMSENGYIIDALDLSDGSTFNLSNGEHLFVSNVPDGVFYTIEEAENSDYTTTSTGASGTVANGEASAAVFTNTYDPAIVTLSGADNLAVSKELAGRAWDGASFDFKLVPSEPTYPMPASNLLTLSSETGAAGSSVSGAFGDIVYSAAGTYTYTISEVRPDDAAAGITYSSAVYEVTVVVADGADGTLSATATLAQTKTDTGEEVEDIAVARNVASFINTYDAGAVAVSPVGTKVYVDSSGATTLQTGMFSFEVSAYSDGAPLPDQTVYTNTGTQIVFQPVVYTQPGVYKYKIAELEPANANAALVWDQEPVIATVTVAEKDGALAATVTYATEDGTALDSCTFTNAYEPTPATLDFAAKKVLTGRSLTGSESFSFAVTTSDPATQAAIKSGAVTGVTAPGSTVKLTPAQALNSGISTGTVYGLQENVAQDIDFSTVTFNRTGAYQFEIGEVKGTLWAVNYDQAPIDVTVVVTEKDGALVATPTYTSPDGHSTTTFTNKYDANPVTATINMEKVLTGRDWKDTDRFTATITTQDPYSPLPPETTATFTADSRTASFEIPFSVAGYYYYQVKETDLGVTNIAYDSTTWNVEVVVTEGENDKLETQVLYVASDPSVDKITFTNTYALNPVRVELATQKTLEGRDMLAGESFGFTVTPDMDDASTVAALEQGLITADKNAAGVASTTTDPTADTVLATASVTGLKDGVAGAADFSAISFATTGTFKFWLQETAGSLADVTYDSHKELVTVTVTENGTAYVADAVYTSTAHDGANEFVNIYDAAPVVVGGAGAAEKIELGKMLVGRDGADGESFTFTLAPESLPAGADASLAKTRTLTLAAGADGELVSGAFSDAMSFSAPGEYVYKLTETVPADAGDVAYDTTAWLVRVDMAVSDETGALEASVAYSDDGGATYTATMPVFVNKAVAAASHAFTVAKVLEGRPWLSTDAFSATIAAVTPGAPMPAKTTVAFSAAAPAASFGTVAYTAAGTYEYEIREAVPAEADKIAGVAYDTTVHKVAVTVAEKDGALAVTDVAYTDATVDGAGAVELVNTYAPTPLTIDPADADAPDSLSLFASKTLVGVDQGSETFEIAYRVESAPEGATVEGVTTATAEVTGLQDGVAQTVRFANPVTVDTPGVYTVRVTEKIPEGADATGRLGNFTYDDSVYYAVITVTDDYATGRLEGTVAYTTESGAAIVPGTAADGAVTTSYPSFNNFYTPEPVTATYTMKKYLTGRAWTSEDAFKVKLVPASSENPMPASDIATFTQDSPETSYGPITFTEPGTYVYYMQEQADSLGEGTSVMQGYESLKVTTYVTVDQDTGGLSASTVYGNTNGMPYATIFNTYKATPATASGISATKQLAGRAWKSTDRFTFDLVFSSVSVGGTISYTLPSGTTQELMATATMDDKSPVFADLTLTQAGTYTYMLYEVVPDDGIPGITYCSNLIDTVTVKVVDNGQGALTATYTYQNMDYQNLPAGQLPVFTNTYAPTPVSETIDVTKTLSGIDFSDGMTFSATIEAQTAGAPLPDAKTVEITSADVLAVNGGVTTTKPVSFEPIEFTKAGTYYYTVTETDGDNGNMTYDATSYTVKVVVTDDTNTATLSATVEYPTSTGVAVPLTNSYVPAAVSIDSGAYFPPDTENGDGLTQGAPAGSGTYRQYPSGFNVAVEKYLYGRDEFADEKFTFTLTPESFTPGADSPTPVVVPTGDGLTTIFDGNATIEGTDGSAADTVQITGLKNGEPARVEFTHPITFYNTGVYTFTLTEDAANPVVAGTTYSTDVYKVVVTVTNDRGTGTLVATMDYELVGDDGTTTAVKQPEFKNHYTPAPAMLEGSSLAAAKVLTGSDACETRDYTAKLVESAETAATGAVTLENADGTAVDSLEAAIHVGAGQTGETVTAAYDGKIVFTKVGTYTFEETEVDPGAADGVTYDTSTHTVTVTVTEDMVTGTLETAVSYEGGSATPTPFRNEYTTTPAKVAVHATKELEGRDWTAGDEFTFRLTDPATGAVVATATATEADPTATFDALSFDEPGSYTYRLDEVRGSETGMTYDDTVHTVTIEVADDGEGALEATVLYDLKGAGPDESEYALFSAAPVFTNTYESTAKFSDAAYVHATKTLEGAASANGQFTFELVPDDAASAALLGETALSNQAAAAGEPGVLEDADGRTLAELLGNIEFDNAEAGETFGWTLKETSAAAAGYTLDATVHTIRVKVSTDGAGATLLDVYVDGASAGSTGATGSATIAFTNRYAAASGPVTIRATKELTGETLAGGEFTFSLSDSLGDELATATNEADGSVAFTLPSCTWEQCLKDLEDGRATAATVDGHDAAKYVFTIAEDTASLLGGVACVRPGFSVTVTMVNEGNGTLDPVVTYPDDTTIVNRYSTNQAVATIVGTKVVAATGIDVEAPDVAGKYTFTISGDGPLPADTTATNDASGTVEFGQIVYTLDDLDGEASKTFTYTVTESGHVAGVTNDVETARTVTVTVSNDGTGTLTATVGGRDAGGADFSFTNVYGVAPVRSGTTVIPDATTVGGTDSAVPLGKVMEGRDLEAGEFRFELVDSQTGEVASSGTNEANGHIDMTDVTFTHPGIYSFTLSEVKGDEPGVTYDPTVYSVKADVKDNGNGTMAVVWTIAGTTDLVFNNRYEPADGASTVVATKVYKNAELAAGEFEFELVGADGTVVGTAKNTKAGGVVFAPIEYDQAGTYEYTLREVAGDQAGVTYDPTEVKVTVTVVNDNATGKLVATVAYDPEPTFTNVYTAKPVSVALSATKTLANRDLEAGAFTFEALDADGKTVSTATNAADGSIDFDPMTFSEPGTYVYTIREVAGDDEAVTYDSKVVTATITVANDYEKGELTASVSYDPENVFANVCAPEAASATISATKRLEGRELAAGEFTFELVDADGKVVATTTNRADGSVEFGPLSWSEAGTYSYTVREVAGDEKDVTYDSKTVGVTVTVTNDMKGQLSASVQYDGVAMFTNTYSVPTAVRDTGEEPETPSAPKTPTSKVTLPVNARKVAMGVSPKTGDETATTPVAIAVVLGVALIGGGAALFRSKRRS